MHKQIKPMGCALLAALLLVACGGGGSDGELQPAAPDVPDEALVSSESFTEWAKGLRASDSVEPLNMERLVSAPSSETAEPVSLD